MIPNCYQKENLPTKFCPGCGYGIILKNLGYVFDDLEINQKSILGLDIGCALLAWNLYNVDTIQTHHGRTVSVISGFKYAKPNSIGIALVGDGGAYAIGLQSLLHSAHRGDPITVIVVNNTLYAMTGGQSSPTTLPEEITTTTPSGRDTKKTGIPFLGPESISVITSRQAYIVRTSVSKPNQIYEYLKKAILNQIKNESFSFVEILSLCPTNWKTNAKESFEFLKKMENYYKLGELKIR